VTTESGDTDADAGRRAAAAGAGNELAEDAHEAEPADCADAYDEPRSTDDIAERDADLAETERGAPPGRSFARDFRRAPALTVAEWRAAKAKRVKRVTPTRSKPRAGRRTSRAPTIARARVTDGASQGAEPPPAGSLPPSSNESCDLSDESAAVASVKADEVLPLSDRERRLIDFLVDEALNAWWKQNSRD